MMEVAQSRMSSERASEKVPRFTSRLCWIMESRLQQMVRSRMGRGRSHLLRRSVLSYKGLQYPERTSLIESAKNITGSDKKNSCCKRLLQSIYKTVLRMAAGVLVGEHNPPCALSSVIFR